MAALERLSAASTITLAVLAGIATLDATRVVMPATALVVEVMAVSGLARRHALMLGDDLHGCP